MNRFRVSKNTSVAALAQSLWLELKANDSVEISAIGLGSTHNMVKAVASLEAFCTPRPNVTMGWDEVDGVDGVDGGTISALVFTVTKPENAVALLPEHE